MARDATTQNCHTILEKALSAVPPELRPAPPYHLGGPLPTCPATGQIGLALWCAELVADRLHPGEKATFTSVLKQVRAFLAKPDRAQYEALLKLGATQKGESEALAVARRAASAAATLARGKADLVFTGASAAVVRTVRMLVERPAPALDARAFLLHLDEAIMRLECEAAVEKVTKQRPKVERVVGRSDGGKGKAAYFIAQLEGGAWGALLKQDRKWTWLTGPRDELLAQLPFATAQLADSTLPEDDYAFRG